MDFKLNRNRIILLIVVFFILLGFGLYYYQKYGQEIKTYGLYVLIGIMIFIFFIATGNGPKRRRSPEEQRAYNEEIGRLEAQKDHAKGERIRKENTKFYDNLVDDFFGFSKKKKRR